MIAGRAATESTISPHSSSSSAGSTVSGDREVSGGSTFVVSSTWLLAAWVSKIDQGSSCVEMSGVDGGRVDEWRDVVLLKASPTVGELAGGGDGSGDTRLFDEAFEPNDAAASDLCRW